MNDAVTMPLFPPVKYDVKPILSEPELAVSSCKFALEFGKGATWTVSAGSWNVNATVSSEPPKSRVPPPTPEPFAGLFICNNDPVIDELSTFVTPSCGRTLSGT